MYKKYNSEPKSLSPLSIRRSFNEVDYKPILEGLTPFLIIAATFIWLWK